MNGGKHCCWRKKKGSHPLLKVASPDILHNFATLLSLTMCGRADHSPSERAVVECLLSSGRLSLRRIAEEAGASEKSV